MNPRQGTFPPTHWTLVRNASKKDAVGRAALEEICQLYWNPLYYFVRRQGRSVEDAQDITQAFFEYLISGNYLVNADRTKGRLRSYLLGALKHFLAAQYRKENALKRKPERALIDFVDVEITLPSDGENEVASPEEIYDRRWALTMLDSAVSTLAQEYASKGREKLFEVLSPFISWNAEAISYSEVGSKLAINEGAAKVAVHRMRQRYRVLIREQIEMTVSSPDEVSEEINYLVQVLR